MDYRSTPQPHTLQQILDYAEQWPHHIASGYSALALYRLPYLTDTAPITFIAPTSRNRAPTPTTPGLKRRGAAGIALTTVHHFGQTIYAAAPAHATVQALQMLKNGEHSPAVTTPEGFAPLLVQAVQLVDCVRRHLNVSTSSLRQAAQWRVEKRWLNRIIRLSSKLADSPRETELRLLLHTMTKRRRLKLSEQVPVYRGHRLVTTCDFAIEPLKIGIMYDGQHHWEYDQRQKDARINLDLALEGWTVVRFAAATFHEVVPRLEELLDQM